MAIVFSFGALAYWGLSEFGHTPYMFIIMAALIFFTWGEIFSLFPATCTDTFGAKYAATNAGLLYTAKGTAAWIVPLANLLKNYSGHWHWVFAIATTMNLWLPRLRCLYLSRCGEGRPLDDPQIAPRCCWRRSRAHAVCTAGMRWKSSVFRSWQTYALPAVRTRRHVAPNYRDRRVAVLGRKSDRGDMSACA